MAHSTPVGALLSIFSILGVALGCIVYAVLASNLEVNFRVLFLMWGVALKCIVYAVSTLRRTNSLYRYGA